MPKYKTELFQKINLINSALSNSSDSAQLIGYAIIKGILEFNDVFSANEQSQFEQVKTIYQALDSTLQSLHEQNLDPNNTLCEMIAFGEQTKDDFLNQNYKSDSLQNHLQLLYGRKGNLEEKARRLGTAIQETVQGTTLPNNKSRLLSDYSQIKEYLKGRK